MTASDSVILPINYIVWRKSGTVLTGPAPTPLYSEIEATNARYVFSFATRVGLA